MTANPAYAPAQTQREVVKDMNKKIFRSTVLVAMLVLLVSVALIMGVLYGAFERQIQGELKIESEYLATAVKRDGAEALEGLDIGERRATLISTDGSVMADTAADASALDNHADRSEVAEAFKNGSGMSVRYSDTLTEKTVYYAKLLDDGSVLRISTTQYTVLSVLISLIQPILFVIFAVLILSFCLSSRISHSIIRPINDINPDDPDSADVYEELSPLISKISAQKRIIGEQLRDAKQKQEEFRLITENMSEGFVVIDRQMRVLTYNSAAFRLLGAEGVPLDSETESVLMLNRSREFRDAVNGALGGQRTEVQITLGENTYDIISSPVLGDSEDQEALTSPIGAVILILDVTESARREQLRREFTSNVSHELKTPLTSISGFAEMMSAGGMDEATVKDFSKSIYDEAQRMITLVGDIIKLSELDEGAIDDENESVELAELSRNIADRLRVEADRAGVTLHVYGEGGVVSGSRRILDEMICNLCDNAIKYNRKGGTVDIIVTSDGSRTAIAVRDTGIGIPKSQQSRVFERFYRVDKSHSKAIGGTGLGLSIVKHGAAYHNAEVKLESEEGVGTTVTLIFNGKK